jgi:beta-lactamase superfamily II metal-dependent hydrolase
MTLIKSYSVGNGDMFYIRHETDNFTIIDCSIPEDRRGGILADLTTASKGKYCTRFISTHPDQDHIGGLVELDDHLEFKNFYTVKNQATKKDPTKDFVRYVELRESKKAFYISKGCTRKWMNESDEKRGSSGINVLWPDTSNQDYRDELALAAAGESPNNISPVIKYSMRDGVKVLWMGDLETDFMAKIFDHVNVPKVDILFAPHHGRASGKVPDTWLKKLDPRVVVVGEAPSGHLNYYPGYDTITQNSAGDILFDCQVGKVRIYTGQEAYQVNFLAEENLKTFGLDVFDGLYYLGTLNL